MMQHLRLLQANPVVSVQRLCELSGVSPRTIYRDITLLTRMNIPIYYDDGYRLAQTNQLPIPEFDAGELELLSFCLTHNPLAGFPSFARRFRQLEKRILHRAHSRETSASVRALPATRDIATPVSALEDRIIQRFLRAMERKCAVRVVLKEDPRQPLFGLPRGIAFRDNSVLLLVDRLPTEARTEVRLIQIKEIRVTSSRGTRTTSRVGRESRSGKNALTNRSE